MSLQSRAELCFDIAGIHRGKVTIYAGPGKDGNQAVAVFDIPGAGTFVGRHLSGAMDEWVSGLLEEVGRIAQGKPVQA
ncbi:hypothetical protein [Paenarthrobacter sp. JL.01a]|uniref:hypothetical protein n=1 Tax=Paenarthrobacter sp. JL.01a TaxID=2979324 RepID=UPI0021CADDE6|nr:hypothetical protein [Paenarthrobacter sp. JL.01a]UXM91502.1 hypothetical protein N5P29_19755 [Paenarthrobacter sp. JL.01a]